MSSWYIQEASENGPRALTDGHQRIHLIPEDVILKMTPNNVKKLHRICVDIRPIIHEDGNADCIKAIDYMVSTLNRAKESLGHVRGDRWS